MLCRGRLPERSKMINVCSLEYDLTKHYPLSLVLLKVDGSEMVL